MEERRSLGRAEATESYKEQSGSLENNPVGLKGLCTAERAALCFIYQCTPVASASENALFNHEREAGAGGCLCPGS